MIKPHQKIKNINNKENGKNNIVTEEGPWRSQEARPTTNMAEAPDPYR